MKSLLTLFSLACVSVVVCAQAHTISASYAEIRLDGTELVWFLKLPTAEMDLSLGLDRNHDGKVDSGEVRQAEDIIRRYILEHTGAAVEGRIVSGLVHVDDLWTDTDGTMFVAAEVHYRLPSESFQKLTLRCDLLREAVAAHQTLSKISLGGTPEEFVFGDGRTYESGPPDQLRAAGQFLEMGILHILTGYDHIAFLFGVLVIGGGWKTVVTVISSFTIAHSITLSLAVTGILDPSTRFVESGIAASIAYIAAENMFFHNFDRRWLITFFFGLLHGFGFADALQALHLSRSLLAPALISFNSGVEIGQLCIVAAFLPVVRFISHHRWHRTFIVASSGVIFVLGLYWLWQRAIPQ